MITKIKIIDMQIHQFPCSFSLYSCKIHWTTHRCWSNNWLSIFFYVFRREISRRFRASFAFGNHATSINGIAWSYTTWIWILFLQKKIRKIANKRQQRFRSQRKKKSNETCSWKIPLPLLALSFVYTVKREPSARIWPFQI